MEFSRGWPITKRNYKVARVAWYEKSTECGASLLECQSRSSVSERPWAKTA